MTIAESWHDLEADLLGPEPDYDSEPPVELDRSTADRHLRRIAHLDARYAADKEVAEAQIEQVRAWLAGRYATYDAQRAWLHSTLRRFHEALLSIDPRAKTVKLPAGELKMRAQQPSWKFTDTAAFLAWAQENAPDVVRPPVPSEPSIDVNAAKKLLTQERRDEHDKVVATVRGVTADGTRPPGLTVDDVDDKFSVEIATEHDAPAPDPQALAAAMTEPF